VVTLATAREKALQARRAISNGEDPIAARRAERSNGALPTFRDMADEVIALERPKSTNDKVRYQWELLLGPRYCAAILDKHVHAIRTGDIEQLLRPVWTAKPETARKLYRRVRRVFEHARVRLRDRHGISMGENPAHWDDLKALGFEAPRKLSRGPYPSLAYPELPAFMAALRLREGFAPRALELLILTAVRTDSVRRAEWSEFDLDAAVWSIPIAHMKDKRTRTEPFRVPLAPPVLRLLRELRENRTGDVLFPGPSGEPLSNMAMLALLRKMNASDDGKPRWRDPRDARPIVPHGFRSTFRTWAEDETRHPRSVIEQAMSHQVGTEVERAYRRTDVLEKRRALMADWAAFALE
ncbi:site-specific integrase, partial [Nostoc sp. NIES-2111]